MVHPYEPPPPLPAENGVHVWRTAIVVPIITFFFVAARFYTRLYMLRRRPTIDDCTFPSCNYCSTLPSAHPPCRHRCLYHGHQYCTWRANSSCDVSWHGSAHMAIHARVKLRVLSLDRNIVTVLYRRPRRFQDRPDTALSTNIWACEQEIQNRLLPHAFLHPGISHRQPFHRISGMLADSEKVASRPERTLH